MVLILADMEPFRQEFMDRSVHILSIHSTSDLDPSHNANQQLGAIIAIVTKRSWGDKTIGARDQVVAKHEKEYEFYQDVKWGDLTCSVDHS